MSNDVETLINRLRQERFFGSVEIKMEAGKIVLVRKTETFKPTQAGYGDNRGTNNEKQ